MIEEEEEVRDEDFNLDEAEDHHFDDNHQVSSNMTDKKLLRENWTKAEKAMMLDGTSIDMTADDDLLPQGRLNGF